MQILKKESIKEIEERYKRLIDRTETEEGLKEVLQWEGKVYKQNPKAKLLKFLEDKKVKETDKVLKEIELIENAKDFNGEFIITVEWKPSRMWRSNPRAYTNYGFEGESIGGCGYDKLSTAVAQALNSNLSLLKLLCAKKEASISKAKRIKNPDGTSLSTSDINRKYLGYGAGYNLLPKFEGGVGVSCHQRIVEGLGLKWMNVTSTPNTDVFLITRK